LWGALVESGFFLVTNRWAQVVRDRALGRDTFDVSQIYSHMAGSLLTVTT
jgi:hypothetical protein